MGSLLAIAELKLPATMVIVWGACDKTPKTT